jgi:hypothetical protein
MSGGGMLLWSSDANISACIFTDNKVTQGGGAIDIRIITVNEICYAKIANCIFKDNFAAYGGAIMNGAVYNLPEDLTIKNCLFVGNKVDTWGGAIYHYCSSPAITNCTFSGNSAKYDAPLGEGGAIYNRYDSRYGGSSPVLKNCIFWGNIATYEGNEIYNETNCDPNISYCNIQGSGGSGPNTWDPNFGNDDGGNIDVDPCFVHPGLWVDVNRALSFDGSGDYVDVGDPNDDSLDFGTNTDFSLSLWFKTSTSDAGFFVNKRAKGKTKGYDTYILGGQIWARIGNTAFFIGTATTETFNDDNWHHLVAVYDRDDVMTVYVDRTSLSETGRSTMRIMTARWTMSACTTRSCLSTTSATFIRTVPHGAEAPATWYPAGSSTEMQMIRRPATTELSMERPGQPASLRQMTSIPSG